MTKCSTKGYMIKMVGLDMDGTLLTTDKELTEHTKKVLREAIDRGVAVVPATGRPLTGIPRNSHGIYSQVCQLLRTRKGAVSSDDYQSVNAIFFTNRCRLLLALLCAHLLTAGCLQNGTSSLDRVGYISCSQVNDFFIQKSLISFADTSYLNAFP